MCTCVQVPVEVSYVGSPGIGVTGSSKPCNMGAGTELNGSLKE